MFFYEQNGVSTLKAKKAAAQVSNASPPNPPFTEAENGLSKAPNPTEPPKAQANSLSTQQQQKQQQQQPCSTLPTAREREASSQPPSTSQAKAPIHTPLIDHLQNIVQLGRELRDTAQELQALNAVSPSQIALLQVRRYYTPPLFTRPSFYFTIPFLLQEAFSLIAYENPYESPFADFMHPRHRKVLAESVNNAILG